MHRLRRSGGVVRLGRVDRPDRDERGQRQPDLLVVDGRAVPLDQPAALQPLDALVHGRGGQACRLPEIGVGHAAVGREQRQDLSVGVFHTRHPSEVAGAGQSVSGWHSATSMCMTMATGSMRPSVMQTVSFSHR